MGEVEPGDGQARDEPGTAAYVVAGCTPWARRAFFEYLVDLPGKWWYARTPAEVRLVVQQWAPRAAFFLHWRWRVPPAVLGATECIGFHLGSFGQYRGGTPLQHQILDGREVATLTMYRMAEHLDAGPVYDREAVTLHGSAEAVYARAMGAAASMIAWYAEGRYAFPPVEVELGSLLPRRTPAESALPARVADVGDVGVVHDFIRMLDAAGYPHAFLDHGRLRLTFRRAVLYDGRVECDCTITLRDESK